MTLEPGVSGAELDPICERATRDAAELLESLGHDVQEISAPWAGMDLLPDFTRTFGPQVSMQTFVGGQIAGREPTEDDVEPLTWELYKHASQEVSSIDFQEAARNIEAATRMVIASLGDYDALLMPSLAQRPVPIGDIDGMGPEPWESFVRSGHFTPYTALFNASGQPAISLPLYHGEDGLPTGIQLAARPAAEEVLLKLGAQLEQALPWADRMPDP